MSCSSCKYLKEEDKKYGEVSGCCYYCSKINSYVNGSDNSCRSFEKSYRSSYLNDSIYEDGELYYSDSRDFGLYVIFVVILVILAIIINI